MTHGFQEFGRRLPGGVKLEAQFEVAADHVGEQGVVAFHVPGGCGAVWRECHNGVLVEAVQLVYRPFLR